LNKKIYLVRANKPSFGGAEKYLNRLSKAMKNENIEHQIVYSFFPKFLPSWLRAILFNIQVKLMKRDKFYFSLDRITCPDVYRAGDGVHKKILSIVNKSKTNLLHPVYLYLEKHCFNNAKHIIANSKMVKEQIIEKYNINPNKISIIYNGINLNEIDYKKSYNKLSKEFSLSNNQSILLFVGSGFKRKGLIEFLQIISKLKTKDIKAFIVGKDKNIKYYQNLSKKLNIDSQVVFTGPRNNVNDFYTISDIFLFPTHYEPFGNVILEAMNLRNVVFTTKHCGGSELLDSEFIMQNPDDISVVQKIDNLLENSDKLEMIQEKNRFKSTQFSIEKNLSRTIKIIDENIN